MSKIEGYVCDVCRKEFRDKHNLYEIKVRSRKFINYVNYDEIFADRRTIDVCSGCVNKFIEFARGIVYEEENPAKKIMSTSLPVKEVKQNRNDD